MAKVIPVLCENEGGLSHTTRVLTLEERYAKIKTAGMYIDVRNAVPILFIGHETWRCNTWLQALTLAEGML